MPKMAFVTLMLLLLQACTKTSQLFQPLLYAGSQGTQQLTNTSLSHRE